MKHLFSLCLICLLLQVLTSCSSINVSDAIIDSPEDNSIQSLLIEKGTSQITAEQAINVAKMFDINRGRIQTKAESGLNDVYTLYNEEGMPVFYAVNRGWNSGFVIVGASRNYFPILAYVEKATLEKIMITMD
ncbi:MAG: Spi family protease inhibitor [Bacteroidales bacterium]|nr:Spi family protease inhibitor [Bacteroidales bacterium]